MFYNWGFAQFCVLQSGFPNGTRSKFGFSEYPLEKEKTMKVKGQKGSFTVITGSDKPDVVTW